MRRISTAQINQLGYHLSMIDGVETVLSCPYLKYNVGETII